MNACVSRAEFEALRAEVRRLRAIVPGQRLLVGGGATNPADDTTAPGVYFPRSPEPGGDGTELEAMVGIVVPTIGDNAGTLCITDGETTSPIVTVANLDLTDVTTAVLGTWDVDELIALIVALTRASQVLALSWSDNSSQSRADIGTIYEAFPAGAVGWCLPGLDQIPFPPTSAQLIIRTTAVSAAGGTWSVRVYDATASLAVAEITGIAVGANALANTTTLVSWPTTAASNVSIQVKHSTGAAGNSLQLHSAHMLVKGA
jgi:hypothetical protein